MEIRRLRASEMEQAWELDREAFHSPDAQREPFLGFGHEHLLGAFDGERLLALTGAFGMGQFFGGRRVSMGGLTSVAVAPDCRGRGLAKRVVARCLEEMVARGDAISSLFPAVTNLYRRLGWEVAGGVAWRSVEPVRLRGIAPPEAARVRPAGEGDRPAIRACYARLARECNGLLDRPEAWWRVREARAAQGYRYVAVEGDEVTGYLVYSQQDGSMAPGGPFRLQLDDFFWTTRDAGLALWRLLASWSSQVETIHYRVGVEDPSVLLLPEQVTRTQVELRWMTRVLDAEAAVAARGFPLGLDVEVPLELSDEALPANSGPRVLRVRKGRGHLEPGGRGGASLDIGAFSSLYTGFANTATLVRAGRLAGGSAEERAALDACFAGQTPSLLDEF